jgi:hypothetical protein
LTTSQVKAEMERLVTSKLSWVVEELEPNRFKTVFSSKGEMKWMIEWGTLETKDGMAKLKVEELGSGSKAKHVMEKVWVQMTRLPSELRDFLNLWAIGTILGVTKEVDMIFTRHYKRPRMQILRLDPALIPTSVDVVIGESVFELHFKVEAEGMEEDPKPLEMEDDCDDFGKRADDDVGNEEQCDYMQEDSDKHTGNKEGARLDDTKQKGVSGSHKNVQSVSVLTAQDNELDGALTPLGSLEDGLDEEDFDLQFEEEMQDFHVEDNLGEMLASPTARGQQEMAAIPEGAPLRVQARGERLR